MDREDILNKVFETNNEKYDHEADMARAQLMRTAENAIKLFKMIKPGDNLEGWTAAKITKASDYLQSVTGYMEYEMFKEKEKEHMMSIKDSDDDYHESLAQKLDKYQRQTQDLDDLESSIRKSGQWNDEFEKEFKSRRQQMAYDKVKAKAKYE